jgi:hypothetical protein
MQRQLSIFDTLQPLDTALAKIRPGDWVKLEKDAAGAIDWSPGEVLQIESIDPASGRARFWNDRVQEWGYLRSADIALTVPPLKVLKKQPIAPVEEVPPTLADTESIPEVAEFDSVSVQPIARDTESIPETVEFDSVSVQPIARDTESTAPPADTESIPEPNNSVSRAIATYRPRGTARGGEYFRFSYRAGRKMKHLYQFPKVLLQILPLK